MKSVVRDIGAAGAAALALSMTMVGSASAHHSTPASPDDALTACGQVVTANLTLSHNVGPCAGTHGLRVTASGITVNLNGFSITGDGSATDGAGDAGILLDGVSNVTVTSPATAKGTVQLFNAGVVINGGSGNKVENLVLQRNQALGKDGRYLTDFGEGIQVANSSSNTIRANHIRENAGYAGITLLGNSDNNKIGNDGISGNGVDDNQVENNDESDSVFAKQTSGIRLEFGANLTVCPNNNTIDGNKVERNGNDGVQMFNCATGNVVVNNALDGNGRDGVHLFPAANSNYIGVTPAGVAGPNTLVDNGDENSGDGIYVGSNDNQVKNNTVTGSADDGIVVGFCRQNLPTSPVVCSAVTGNVVHNNDVVGNGTPGLPPTGNPTLDAEVARHGNGIHALLNTIGNTFSGNRVSGSVMDDLKDDNNNCTNNTWSGNTATKRNPTCLG